MSGPPDSGAQRSDDTEVVPVPSEVRAGRRRIGRPGEGGDAQVIALAKADRAPAPPPGMPLLLLAACGMGGIFAGAEVSMIAFCGQHLHRAASG